MEHSQFMEFVENLFGEILQDQITPELLDTILVGINMVAEEVAAGRITNIYEVMELSEKLKRPDCETCMQISNFKKAIGIMSETIDEQRKCIDMQKLHIGGTCLRINKD